MSESRSHGLNGYQFTSVKSMRLISGSDKVGRVEKICWLPLSWIKIVDDLTALILSSWSN
jgi:hypothetical protein